MARSCCFLIRQFDAEVPIVIVTGRPTLRSSIAAVEHGTYRYLVKPVAPRNLCKTVNDAAARYRLAALKLRALEVCENDGWRSGDGANLSQAFDAALQGPQSSLLFVNLHASDLADPELYSPEAALSSAAERVVLEITERKSLDATPSVRQKMVELRGLGYRIAVDDLGAGYAGLSCVNVLEPDIVKLDMSLIRAIDSSPRKRSLVGSMLRVCQSDLGMQVVCEGGGDCRRTRGVGGVWRDPAPRLFVRSPPG